MTARTIMRAATPRKMPATEMKLMMETKTCLRLARRYLRLIIHS